MTSPSMTPLIIILIIIGLLFIIISCFLMNKSELKTLDTDLLSEDLLKNTLAEVTDETINRTEDELSKISNEKIIAVNDFSNTVLDKINNNHEEVVFLYHMLNEKEAEIKKLMNELKEVSKEKQEQQTSAKDEVEKNKTNLNNLTHVIKDDKVEPLISNVLIDSEVQFIENENKKKKYDSNQTKLNQNNLIQDMYNQGMSVVDIAKELRLGQGEVKLIIDLYKRETK